MALKLSERLESVFSSTSSALSGSSSPFSREFYRKHLGKVILVLFLLYSYVQLRYEYEQTIAEIGELKRTLSDVRYTSIATWGELTSKNKPEIVRSKISDNAKLISADEPPIKIEP
ncbi:MAG: hypothetical protein KBT20_01860 [Bacteroidales bacterium]|nr:hypothetical protein [Candidatus Liminaster caballi]